MAFADMVKDGWMSDDALTYANRRRIFKGVKVMTHDIEKWKEDPECISALKFYSYYKKYGNPDSRGWLEWPCIWVDIIDSFEAVFCG